MVDEESDSDEFGNTYFGVVDRFTRDEGGTHCFSYPYLKIGDKNNDLKQRHGKMMRLGVSITMATGKEAKGLLLQGSLRIHYRNKRGGMKCVLYGVGIGTKSPIQSVPRLPTG